MRLCVVVLNVLGLAIPKLLASDLEVFGHYYYYFFNLFERVREGWRKEREIKAFHPLVHSTDGCNRQAEARESGASSRSPTRMAGAQAL